jgi:polyferredoxin
MSRHVSPRSLSRLVQWAFFLASLWIGWRFFLYCRLAATAGAELARPAGVEGFLPISALLGLRHLLESGQWDPVHPAGLTIFLAALAMALLFRKAFCGQVCPVGFVEERLGRLGQRLGLARSVPVWLERLLRLPKYLLLAFFLGSVWLSMDGDAIEAFLRSSYNITADARMLRFFLHPGLPTLAVLAALTVAGLVWRGSFCRWLCPYGALLGLLALAGPLALRRDPDRCTGCGRCRRACPLDIPVTRGGRPLECSGCAACVLACPTPAGAAGLTLAGRPVPWWLPAAGALAVFAAAYVAAQALGGWDTAMPPAMLRRLYATTLAG